MKKIAGYNMLCPSRTFSVIAGVAISVAYTFAQVPNTPALIDAPAPPSAPIQRLEPASYIGLATSIAPRTLRDQSKLPRGVGVVVDFVDPNSPADRAGIKIGDVIHKLDDQYLVNAHQFTVLVRMRQPGDMIKLAVVRGGEPQLMEVTLVSRDLPPLDESIGLIIPPELRDGPPLPRAGTGLFTGVMSFTDNEQIITITATDTGRTVLIKDRAGATVYEGALNNDEDRLRIPEALRLKVDRVEKGGQRVRKLRQTPDGGSAAVNEP